jgi:hypothetical protein
MRRLALAIGAAGAVLVWPALLGGGAASALPRPASGSLCDDDWVNNPAAMACFTKGEEESRAGVKHPHYVACTAAGEVFCCVDKDSGGQDCEVAARTGPAVSNADLIRAILAAHRTQLTKMRRWDPPQSKPPKARKP